MIKFKKSISEITEPGDCYEVANQLAGLRFGDEGYDSGKAAAEAARLMKQAGWRFLTYSQDGQEIWHPPGSHKLCPECSGQRWLGKPGNYKQCRTCHGIGKVID